MNNLIIITGLAVWLSGCSGSSDDYADNMAREHAEDAPVPNEVSDASPAADVETSSVVYATVDGEEVTGYLARPKGVEGPLPGIIVIQEWWGLNDNIRSMADQLAGEGYQALAVDLYRGQTGSTPDEAMALRFLNLLAHRFGFMIE